MDEVESTFVKPFYLRMMGLRSVQTADALRTDLIGAARAVTPADVSWMLSEGTIGVLS